MKLFRKGMPLILAAVLIISTLAFGDRSYADQYNGENYGPDTQAESYCVINGDTGEVLMSKNKDAHMYPASCTKVMTALLVCENVPDLDAQITFTATAVNVDPSSSTLEPKACAGEVMTVRDVLYGMLLKSANECGAMLGEYVAGSEAAFADMMNARAAEIGCQNTHFCNAYGIHNDDHYTSAYDLCLILQEAMKNERYRELNGTVNYTIPATNMNEARAITMGHKMLNGTIPEEGVIGGKTGSTPQAGKVLVTAVNRDGLYTVSALMHTTAESWYTDEQVLLEYTYGLHDGSLAPVVWVDTDDIVETTGGLKMHVSPSLLSVSPCSVESGARLLRQAVYGNWSRVVYNDTVYYCSSDYLNSLEPEKVPETTAYVPETTAAPVTTESETGQEGAESAESAESTETAETVTDAQVTETQTETETAETDGETSAEKQGVFRKVLSKLGTAGIIIVLLGAAVVVFLIMVRLLIMYNRIQRKKRRDALRRKRRQQAGHKKSSSHGDGKRTSGERRSGERRSGERVYGEKRAGERRPEERRSGQHPQYSEQKHTGRSVYSLPEASDDDDDF